MQIRQLECFKTVITTGTMTRAAELLHISQPAVSNTIATLEHQLGFKLFNRKSGRLQATSEANLFYAEVINMLDTVNQTFEKAAQIRDRKYGHLIISAFPGISIAFLPRLISTFLQERAGVKIRLQSRSFHIVLDQLPSQMFDIAIAELPLDYAGVDIEEITYECDCILPSGHPLTALDVITPKNLDGVPFVSLFRNHISTHQIARAFSEVSANWNVVSEVQYFASACHMVNNGGVVAIADPVISQTFDGGLVRRPFLPKIEYQIGLLLPKDKPISNLAQDFLQLVKANLFLDNCIAS